MMPKGAKKAKIEPTLARVKKIYQFFDIFKKFNNFANFRTCFDEF